MSELRVTTIKDAAGGNVMPVADINQGRAKSWVNLNGTGTIATRDSFNVSSVIDNGTGYYTAVFAANLANANYASFGSSASPGVTLSLATTPFTSPAVNGVGWANVNSSMVGADPTYAALEVLGDI